MPSRDLRPLGVALLVIAPLALGAGECAPGSPARDALGWIHRLVSQVAVLDERVSEVEACTCCCEGIFEPVCTMRGVTYINACEAHCAGARVLAPGPCGPAICGGPEGVPCSPGAYCELPPGCHEPFAEGRCLERPEVCPRHFDPVCGCDGQTYGNDCERRAVGAPLAHPGACQPTAPPCGGFAGFVCPDPSQVCQFPPGTCDIIDNMGSCEVPPDACPFFFDPVCGCDGQTYGNACMALAQQAQIDHPGPCP